MVFCSVKKSIEKVFLSLKTECKHQALLENSNKFLKRQRHYPFQQIQLNGNWVGSY